MYNNHQKEKIYDFDKEIDKEEMRKKIIEAFKNKEKHPLNEILKYIIIPTCLIYAIFLVLLHNNNKNEILTYNDTLKVYAYTLKDETLEKTELKDNIKLGLANYNLTMSSVPGYPIIFELNNIDYLTIEITNGSILDWNKKAGKITNLGTTYQLSSNATLYFNINADTNIKIIGIKNKSKIFTKNITISSDNNYNYYAILQNKMSNTHYLIDDSLILNINKINSVDAFLIDADIKTETNYINMLWPSILKNGITLPQDLNKENNNAIFTKDDKTKDYTHLNCYVYNYYNDTNNRNIRLAFSENDKPIRDYYFSEENAKKSTINNYEIVIFECNEMYFVEFNYKGFNFDIETTSITQQELISLLQSILN